MRTFFLASLLLFPAAEIFAQSCSNLVIRHNYDLPSDCKALTMTMKHDNAGKNFLYVAAKDGGLRIYNDSAAPVLVKTIPASAFRSLHVVNLSQTGSYLYVALGNSFAKAKQAPGFAIVDVRDPAKAEVVSVWSDSKLKSGTGIVECVNDHVYLAAMQYGLMIFDVKDKKNIIPLSSFVPDIHFPDQKADPQKINARGMAIRNDLVHLCYDAGGLRIINVKDKKKPFEAGRFSNPVMNKKPRAYNNIALDDSLAYIAVDYCGLEVLNISDPAKIKLVSWWNPWNCQESAMKWFKSDGHLNEIGFDQENKLLFVSSGKSDLHVLGVRDPSAPQLCTVYGGTENGIGTWGVSIHENKIYLGYICTLGIPFKSNWSGVKILSYETK